MARKQRRKILYIALVAFLLFLSVFGGWSNSPAFAETSETDAPVYSDVLDDLKSDENFNPDEYPQKDDDNSLNVIQIAESTDKELLIYVYQPSGDYRSFKASSINIARETDNSVNLHFDNYHVTYLNSDGVFYKYKVEGFELEERAIRYYNISEILRPFEYMFDTPPSSGTISETPYPVGQLWTVIDLGDEIKYSMTASETIEITQKYVGYIAVVDGVDYNITNMKGTHTIRNFVAFSTNRPIDRLIQVELKYSLQEVTGELCANWMCTYHSLGQKYNETKGTPIEQDPVTIKADQKDGNYQHGIGGNTYTWKNIEKTSDFLANTENQGYKLTDESGRDISGTQWVLSFYKDVRDITINTAALWEFHGKYTNQAVSDVIILRLMFETDGKTYNLGVVDNKQTGDGNPSNTQPAFDFWQWFADLLGIPVAAAKAIIIGIPCVLIFFVLFPILAAFFPVFATVLKAILNGIFAAFKVFFKGIWFIICLPFRGIAALVRKIRERKEKA